VTRAERSFRFDVPLYSVSEAARHIDVPRTTFDTWVRGYSRRPKGRSPVTGASVVTYIPSADGPSVPFIGLAEGFVLAAFREAGVPLQRIRPAITRLQEELGIEHVLASRSLYSDGAEVLYDYAEDTGDTPEGKSARQLVVVRNDQQVFQEVVVRTCAASTSPPTAGHAHSTCRTTETPMSSSTPSAPSASRFSPVAQRASRSCLAGSRPANHSTP
jgi:hypothetical protein